MKPMEQKIVITAVLFLLTIVSGIIVTKLGRPLNVAAFNIHKLIALGAVIYTTIFIINLFKAAGIQGATVTLAVVTALFVIALFATGGMLSFEKTWPVVIKLTHKIAPYLAVISLTAVVYLLVKGK